MPELPEVEVVRAGLARHVVGATITSVEVLHPRPVRRDPRGPAGFAAALGGRRIEDARRRGKYLWLPLDNGDALLGHLGMSGQLLVQPRDSEPERHLRVRIGLEGGPGATGLRQAQSKDLRFVDQRMFGGLSVSAGGAELPPEIAHIARDPLDPEFDDDAFVARVRRRASGIKRQLLDQNLISGVGNIYADEALWRARLHGERAGEKLTGAQVRELLRHSPRRDERGPRAGRDVVRRALRQRQRRVRLLRPVAARLRQGGRALRPVRSTGAAGGLHEPVVVLLPGLPAGPACPPRAGPQGGGPRLTRGPSSETLEDGSATRIQTRSSTLRSPGRFTTWPRR